MTLCRGRSCTKSRYENYSRTFLVSKDMINIPQSADSLTIDVEGHDDHEEGQSPMMKVHELKSEFDPVQGKAWVNAIRTHVVVPLIR